MKKIFATLGAALFALLSLSACGGETDGGLKKVRLNEVTHSVFYAPMYLADSLGYFEDEGIEIELVNGGGADKVMTAVLSGDADIGFCGPEAAFYVATGGTSDTPTVFAQLTMRDGSFLVGRHEEPDFKWENLSGKQILAGRKGGVPAMTFEYILKEHNVKDYTLNFDVAFNNMTAAFIEGTADYCTMFEPVASEVQAAGNGYIVAAVGAASGEVPYTSYIAKKSWIDSNKDTVKGFLRAMLKAVKYAMEESPETIAKGLTGAFPDTTEASLATSIRSYQGIDAWAENMQITEASYKRLLDIIEEAGELTERIPFTTIADNTLVKEVYEELF